MSTTVSKWRNLISHESLFLGGEEFLPNWYLSYLDFTILLTLVG